MFIASVRTLMWMYIRYCGQVVDINTVAVTSRLLNGIEGNKVLYFLQLLYRVIFHGMLCLVLCLPWLWYDLGYLSHRHYMPCDTSVVIMICLVISFPSPWHGLWYISHSHNHNMPWNTSPIDIKCHAIVSHRHYVLHDTSPIAMTSVWYASNRHTMPCDILPSPLRAL